MLLPSVVLASVLAVQSPYTESLDVSVVSFDVNVTDRAGRPVPGLAAEDFEVVCDGQVQPLTHFSESTLAGETSRRAVTVFVDDIHQTTRGVERDRLFADLKSFLRDNVRSGDAAAVVEWRGAMHVTQTYTDDLAALERALDAVAARKPAVAPDEWTALAVIERAKMWSRIASGDPGGALAPLQQGNAESMALAERAMAEMRAKSMALRAVAGSLATRDGRRALLFVSHRFSDVAGAEYLFHRAERTMGYSTKELQDSVIEAANAANVAVYSFYPEGPPRDEVASAADDFVARHHGRRWSARTAFNNEKVALEKLAGSTGGIVALNAAEIRRSLPRVADDLQSYYSMAFRLRDPSPGARRLEVRARRPNLVVRAPRELVVESDESRLQRTIAASLFDPQGTRGDLPWRFVTSEPRIDGRKRVYTFRLQIPVRLLTATPAGATRSGAFLVYFTAGGEMATSRRPFEIPEGDLDRVRAGIFTYDLVIETRAEDTRVAIAVVDEVSRRHGIVRLDLPLPIR
jgi:VWFA-related protein